MTPGPLPFPAGSFDTVTARVVFRSVPDPERALAEARRVLRPCGVLRFYEHVPARRPETGPMAGPPAPAVEHARWPLPSQPDPVAAIGSASVPVTQVDPFAIAPGPPPIVRPLTCSARRRGGRHPPRQEPRLP
ncbi:MAG: class I SAM-dependent methyltransferase [Acidimicrobiales bacterium]